MRVRLFPGPIYPGRRGKTGINSTGRCDQCQKAAERRVLAHFCSFFSQIRHFAPEVPLCPVPLFLQPPAALAVVAAFFTRILFFYVFKCHRKKVSDYFGPQKALSTRAKTWREQKLGRRAIKKQLAGAPAICLLAIVPAEDNTGTCSLQERKGGKKHRCPEVHCRAVSCMVLQFCTVWYSVVQFCIVWYSAVQCYTVWYSVLQFCTVLHSVVQWGTALYSVVQCSTVLYSVVQCSTVL